ncbi:hypothetical protein C8R48DRAFT_675874 [Suillus tomentosus]|nr:hypothetical protein C8R48DRAFT_675874 [Suillus tomentosus]
MLSNNRHPYEDAFTFSASERQSTYILLQVAIQPSNPCENHYLCTATGVCSQASDSQVIILPQISTKPSYLSSGFDNATVYLSSGFDNRRYQLVFFTPHLGILEVCL